MHNIISLSIGENDDAKVAAVFISLGVCEVLTGVTLGRITEKFNLYNLATVGTLLAEVAIVLSFLALFLKDYTLCFVVGGLWGVTDCYVNTVGQAICS